MKVLQASASGGVLNHFGSDYLVSLSDMFYLGGPLSLRGFQTRGVGPRSEGDALGSNVSYSVGLNYKALMKENVIVVLVDWFASIYSITI